MYGWEQAAARITDDQSQMNVNDSFCDGTPGRCERDDGALFCASETVFICVKQFKCTSQESAVLSSDVFVTNTGFS